MMSNPNNQYDMFGVPISDSWEDEMDSASLGTPENKDENPSTTQTDNDQVRYQYWQSQYDRTQNQYKKLQEENEALKQQMTTMQQYLASIAQQQEQPQEEEDEEFPDPPPAPVRPYNYSQVEAYSDPNSESAKYLSALIDYNTRMNQYNALKNEWIQAKQKERLEQLQREQEEKFGQLKGANEVKTALDSVINTIMNNYGVDYNTALDFVQTMSDDSSITIDNLFQLYQMRKMQNGTNPVAPSPMYSPLPNPNAQFNPYGANAPSPDFIQRQRAQSVPPTMGVHNAQSEGATDPTLELIRQAIKQSNRNTQF
jgi:hypothetical protein